MTKQEFLAASLPYGLKCITNICSGQDKNLILPIMGINHIKDNYTIRFYTNGEYGDCFLEDVIPIIRPIDSLVKECVQADYNDGKPFIPIVELLKAIYPIKEEDKGTVYEIIDIDRSGYPRAYYRYLATRDIIINPFDANAMPHWVFQQLLKWHFDLISEDCERVYVTDKFNPYI